MKRQALAGGILALALCLPVTAYVEIPYTLGRVIAESSHIVLMEVDAGQQGEEPASSSRRSRTSRASIPSSRSSTTSAQRGFHPREWQNIMAWAEPGKKAVFFHNGGASETCIGTYWYQCYQRRRVVGHEPRRAVPAAHLLRRRREAGRRGDGDAAGQGGRGALHGGRQRASSSTCARARCRSSRRA